MELHFNRHVKRLLPAFFTVLVLLAGGYFSLRNPVTVYSQTLPPVPEGQQFRIVLGLKDTTPKTWKGTITVSGGEILGLAGWRSSPRDAADSSGSFSFTTKSLYSKTSFDPANSTAKPALTGNPIGITSRRGFC